MQGKIDKNQRSKIRGKNSTSHKDENLCIRLSCMYSDSKRLIIYTIAKKIEVAKIWLPQLNILFFLFCIPSITKPIWWCLFQFHNPTETWFPRSKQINDLIFEALIPFHFLKFYHQTKIQMCTTHSQQNKQSSRRGKPNYLH